MERYTLVVTSLGPRPKAVARALRQELPQEEVDRILANVPTVALQGAPFPIAQRLRRLLLVRGADVEVRLDGVVPEAQGGAALDRFTALDASRVRSRLSFLGVLVGALLGLIGGWVAFNLLLGKACASPDPETSLGCGMVALFALSIGIAAGIALCVIMGGVLARKLIERSSAPGGKVFRISWGWLALRPSLRELLIFIVRDRSARRAAIPVVAAVVVVAALLGIQAFLQRGRTQVHVLLEDMGGTTFSIDGGSCSGTGAYNRFREGADVFVSDLAGHRLAAMKLGSGAAQIGYCEFSAKVKLPDQGVYRIEFAGERFLFVPGEFKEVSFLIPLERINTCQGIPIVVDPSLGSHCAEVG
jgi:hypothetical protein